MTVAMLIVLLGLGTWQVKRLFWKEALLAQIDHAETAAPVPLGLTPEPFTKISVTGTFLPDDAALYGAIVRTVPSGPTMGARLIVPLRETNGDVILVDRGWVPLSRSGPIDQPEGPVTVAGYVRFGDQTHWFSARDDPADRRFYTLDPKAIGDAVGQPHVRDFVLVVLAPVQTLEKVSAGEKVNAGEKANAGEKVNAGEDDDAVVTHWPDPARHLPRPPNNHLSYAFTWYGLAVALLVIFVVWARRASRI
jgi:surfeit locus 1 family protein